jgi:ferrochelatase
MTSARIEHSHPPVKHAKVAVLLVKLGTPDGTDYVSMRRYLKEFLTTSA